MNKPRLVVLSDLYGIPNEPWMEAYRNELIPHLTLIEYDCRQLAEIDHLAPTEIHAAFANGGIERAAKNLLLAESTPSHLLGFSVGGTIAWKYALESTNAISVTTVSATRLRNETKIPTSLNSIYFGEREEFGPQQEWFAQMNIEPIVFPNLGHECYKHSAIIPMICQKIISRL